MNVMTDDDLFYALQSAFIRGAIWFAKNKDPHGVDKAAYDYADYETSPVTKAEREKENGGAV